MGPQGSSSRLPSPRRWESELRLASADSGSGLMKLCLWQSRELINVWAEAHCPPYPSSPGGTSTQAQAEPGWTYLR